MSINDAPIYDFAAWIELAPDFDWDLLSADPAPEPDPDPDQPGTYAAEYTAEY